MSANTCKTCTGARLKPEALAVTIAGTNIDTCDEDVGRARGAPFSRDFVPTQREELIAHQILKEIRARLGFLANVGLGYLNLARNATTLSGGESQRIRLATQIGSLARRRVVYSRRTVDRACTSATTTGCWQR